MKILKTNKLNVKNCYVSLKNVPPKEYPTIDEMEVSQSILELFKPEIEDFITLQARIESVVERSNNGEKIEAEVKEVNRLFKSLEESYEKKQVSIDFEDEEFKTFFQQFERWGKNWFISVDKFLSFRKDMNVTNQQPKKKG